MRCVPQVSKSFRKLVDALHYIARNRMFYPAPRLLERSQRFGERNVHKFLPISPKECKNSLETFMFSSFDVSAIAAGDTFGVATLVRSKHDVVRRRISKSGGIAKFGAHLACGIPSGNP